MRLGWIAVAMVGLGCGGKPPTPFASGLLNDPGVGLAAFRQEVYAIDASHTLVRISPDGGTAALAQSAGLAYVIKADAANVYWTDGASARVAPLDGGSAQVLGAAANGWNVQDLGPSGGDRVFWIEDSTDPGAPSQTRLMRASTAAGSTAAEIDRFDGMTFAFATDLDSLYWAGTSGVWRRDNADGATNSVVRLSDGAIAGNVVSDGTRLYWTEQETQGDALYAVARAGGSPQRLASVGRARALALDGEYVYLRTDRSSSGSCIERVPLQGGASEAMAQSPSDAFDLAVGDDALFWLEGGQLVRLLKKDAAPDPNLCAG